METRRSLCVLVLLLSLDAASSGDSPKGLLCVNDYINTVTCAWHGSAWSPASNCSISAVKNIWIAEKLRRKRGQMIRSCMLEQNGNAPPSCSVAFENTEFNNYGNIRSIGLKCDGTLVDNLTDYRPRSQIKMNPPTAPVVNVTANDTWVSWGANGSWSKFETSEFHAQLKQKNQRWEVREANRAQINGRFKWFNLFLSSMEAYDLYTHELKVRVQSWKVMGLCEVKVRVRPNKPPNEYWSNWSPATSWVVVSERVGTSLKDKDWPLDQTLWVKQMVLGLGVVCASILVLYAGCLRTRGHKKKMVPNPSQYFCTFKSLYEGNLKTWLNPTEAFFTTQPVNGISLVEVSSAFDGAPMKSDHSTSSDNGGNADSGSSSSSSFFNIGYFLSDSSSSSAPTVRAPAYFTYPDGRDGGKASITVSLCSSFGTTSSYESLARDPQSPDSGFSFRREGEAGNEDTKAPEDQKCPLLALPPQHHSSPPQPSPPHLSSDDPLTDPAEGGSVFRSSSVNVQPCRTGYLTLKELHMTFSNKSI